LIHRGFIGVGYGGGEDVRDEERHMTAGPDSSPTPPKERAKKNDKGQGWVVAIIALSVAVVIAVILYYGHATRPGWVGVSGKKFWDYLELLIVPVALAIGGYWLNRIQEREREAEAEQRELDRVAAEDARQQRELEFATQATQNAELQSYLDQMGQLLLDRKLRKSEDGSEVRTLAHARTLTVLTRLDGGRKARVVQFLFDSGLITSERPVLDLSQTDLSGAIMPELNLRGANLSGADLRGADLSRTNLRDALLSKADLRGAILTQARLLGTNLSDTNLSDADLRALMGGKPYLRGADLSRANLSDAILKGGILSQTKLIDADLSSADLSNVDLSSADLSGANLSRADLTGALGATPERLAQANSLEGATMRDGQILKSDNNPDGSTFQEWLKSKGRTEEGENRGIS